MPEPLSAAARQVLKGRAHRLDPVVMIGTDGLTPAVLAEIDRALTAHELIKIRVSADGDTRERFMDEICAATGALAVQHIGKVLVVHRKRPPEETAPAPPRPRATRPPPRPARAAPRRAAPRRAKLRSR